MSSLVIVQSTIILPNNPKGGRNIETGRGNTANTPNSPRVDSVFALDLSVLQTSACMEKVPARIFVIFAHTAP